MLLIFLLILFQLTPNLAPFMLLQLALTCVCGAGLPAISESLPAQSIDVGLPSSPEDSNSSFTIRSPVELLPLPKATRTRQKRSSKRGATAILTSLPYKKQLTAMNSCRSAVSGNSHKTGSSKKSFMKKAKV